MVPLAPRGRFHGTGGGWDILGFEAVDGRHADYAPISALDGLGPGTDVLLLTQDR